MAILAWVRKSHLKSWNSLKPDGKWTFTLKKFTSLTPSRIKWMLMSLGLERYRGALVMGLSTQDYNYNYIIEYPSIHQNIHTPQDSHNGTSESSSSLSRQAHTKQHKIPPLKIYRSCSPKAVKFPCAGGMCGWELFSLSLFVSSRYGAILP